MGTGAESGLNLSRLTFNNYSALNLGLTPSAADPANAINVTKNTGDGGVLNLGNIDLTVNTLERGFDTATYTLIKANTLNGATGNIMTATAPGTRADVTATVDPVAKKVKLAIVQNSRDLTWNGGMGFWDVNIHPYGEWVDTGTADSQNFYNLDTVHFTDIDGLQKSLTLSGAVHPVDIFVNNTVNLVDGVDVNAPTFAGDGYLTGIGTTLTKDGPGTLIIANTSASDFTGDVTINQGTVQIASVRLLRSEQHRPCQHRHYANDYLDYSRGKPLVDCRRRRSVADDRCDERHRDDPERVLRRLACRLERNVERGPYYRNFG